MKDLAFTPRSAWEVYGDAKNMKAMRDLAERYREFLTACKTERETIEYLRARLKKAGFSESGKGDKIFRVLQGKTMFVAKKGKGSLEKGLRLLAAHVDTPRLDFKQRPLTEQANVGQAKTHYYGGIRKYQWLARPLAIHGVVVRENGDVVTVVLGEDPKEPVFTIADLLPHLAQSQADVPLSKVFEGEKLNIVLGHQPFATAGATSGGKAKAAKDAKDSPKDPVKARVLSLLNEKYGIREEDLYSAELQAVPAGEARFVGLDSSIIGGYGHDDRVCVFAALEGMLAVKNVTEHTQCLMFWDKEEIGSEGSTGAKSRFFEYCVEECIRMWEPEARFASVMLATKAISADVHAAVDPDWQELHEKLNAALFGNGPCFCKFTGHRGKYEANDAHPEYVGWLRGMLNKADVPWQMAELGKVDGGGGGTVAMYLAAYGMNIIDCGPPIISMHSPFELLSCADLYATRHAFTAFLAAK
ncbi:MAG: putative M18 family aminopeptidase 1 [Desulfovibrio sp.]